MAKDYYSDSELLHEKFKFLSIWSYNDTIHRDDGPAIYSGLYQYSYAWYRHGVIHRKFQPALINSLLSFQSSHSLASDSSYMTYEMDLLPSGEVQCCRYVSEAEYEYYISDTSIRYQNHIFFCNWFIDGQNITDQVQAMMEDGKLNYNFLEWTVKERALFSLKF